IRGHVNPQTPIAHQIDEERWEHLLRGMPEAHRDVYFMPAYHRLHRENGDGDPCCSAVVEGSRVLLVPGLQARIDGSAAPGRAPLRALQTCNGYGGPLASPNADAAFLERAWSVWRRESRRAGLVAAFFRLHPLLDNARWLPPDARVILDRQ